MKRVAVLPDALALGLGLLVQHCKVALKLAVHLMKPLELAVSWWIRQDLLLTEQPLGIA